MPRRNRKLRKNEIRIIKLNRSAIEEILLETLMGLAEKKLNLTHNSDNRIFHMTGDEALNELCFYVCDFSEDILPDFKSIDKYIQENVGITTDSVYKPLQNGQYYQTLYLDELPGTGDG